MKLYAIVGSPNSRKVLAVIDHLKINVEVEYLDLFAGDTKQPAYEAINPNTMVPALVDGDLKLWESNAIIQYLADNSANDSLFPDTPKIRADINRWQCWELAHFNSAFGTLAFESVAKPQFLGAQGNQHIIERSIEQLARFATVLNKHLANRDYVVGDRITLADYSMIHVEFFKEAIPFDWSAFPELNRYFEQMRKSPHWMATAPVSPEAIGRVPK